MAINTFQMVGISIIAALFVILLGFLCWLAYDFFVEDPFDVKRRPKKELRIYTMDERPWPKNSPFGDQDSTETVENMIRRLWDKVPRIRDLLLQRVTRIRLAHLYRRNVSHFILIYTTREGANVFAGPPVTGNFNIVKPTDEDIAFDSYASNDCLPNMLRVRRKQEGGVTKIWSSEGAANRGKLKNVDRMEALYSIHDGFGVVLRPEEELWILAEDAGIYVNKGSTWYLFPRRAMWQLELERYPLTYKTPCIAIGRVDRQCDAVAVDGDLAFYECGDFLTLTGDDRTTVDSFIESTLENLFGAKEYALHY